MHRLKLTILLLCIAGLTSCGLFKKVTTSHESSKEKSKTDSAYSSTVKDQSTITVTEKIDTVVATKPIHIEATKPVTIDSSGIVTAHLDSLLINLKVSYNSITKSMSFDLKKLAELVPVKLDRITIEQRNVDRADNGRVQSETKKKADAGEKVKEPKWGLIFTVFGSVVLFFVAIWLFIKYKIKTVI